MKYYLLTITIYDGDHEYWDKAIVYMKDASDEQKVLTAWAGHDGLQYDEDYRAYMSPRTYRGYRLYHAQEIDENDLPILRKYHIG